MRWFLALVCIILACDSARACIVDLNGYESLRPGMSYRDVVRRLGCDGEEMSHTAMGGFVTSMYMWRGEGIGNMNVMVQNDRLISKSQFGLTRPATSSQEMSTNEQQRLQRLKQRDDEARSTEIQRQNASPGSSFSGGLAALASLALVVIVGLGAIVVVRRMGN